MIDVRCCCDGHLIGTMAGDYQEGRDYKFVLAAAPPFLQDVALAGPLETLTLRCLVWAETDGRDVLGAGLALQSRDYPIEQLRRIAAFTEAHPMTDVEKALEETGERMLKYFAYEHLPPHLQEASKPYSELAMRLAYKHPSNPERTVALRKLLESKDAAVRSLL